MNKRGQYDLNESGWTLIELFTILAIISILAVFAFFAYKNYHQKAKIVNAVATLTNIEKEIEIYLIDKMTLPPDLSFISLPTNRDPWNHPYVYQPDLSITSRVRVGVDINSGYDLYSMGQDGLSNPDIDAVESRDDIIRANNGRFKGLAERY